MSSRDHRRRDRSWERDDRNRDRDRGARSNRGGPSYRDEGRRRSSRSRSPPRRDRDRDRRGSDRRDRDYRHDDKRDGDRRRKDDGREREHDRDYPRSRPRKEDERDVDSPRPTSEGPSREAEQPPAAMDIDPAPSKRPNLDPDAPDEGEGGEEPDDDAGMMAMMGLSGFGSTKGKHIEGNQQGALSVKKQRTWRQYMNRRGGFNRPLDKIK
ncbi:hypothetical protein B0H10DRAFT_1982073 [Mycena sp. CBHHK59/15]|nr:hypothetical protein B0H10DRAFT_1982073 [Mycena sp. CBHHK59/15]